MATTCNTSTNTDGKGEIEHEDFKTFFKESYQKMDENMKTMMDTVLSRVEKMEERHTQRIAEMEKIYLDRLEKLEERYQKSVRNQSERMDKIEDEVQEIAAAHTRRIEQVEGENHDLSCQNTRLKTENENQQEQIDALQYDLEIKSMSLEDMMQYSRRNCLVITGIAETRGENTDDVVKDFAKNKLDVVINDTDIDRTHRLGKHAIGKSRPIIAKFTNYRARHKVIKERRKLRGQSLGIQEHLTPFTQHLLQKAKDLSKRASWVSNAWTWDGKVTVLVERNETKRKVIVSCQEELNKIWKEGDQTTRKRRLTDPNYTKVEWDKTEKND